MSERKRLLDGLFPPRYDFLDLLVTQAEMTVKGVQILLAALKGDKDHYLQELKDLDDRTDQMRHDMERKLGEAFSTPFDRQDIYSMSRQLEAVMNFARTTLVEIDAFEVEPDRCMIDMAEHLLIGTEEVVEGVRTLGQESSKEETRIHRMREEENLIEEIYVLGMREVFTLKDHMIALKKREIYHHLKDAGRALSATVDILHRAAFGLG
ncbi:MAG: DUF47 family protein [Methanomassiliicoccales archaeon]|nr:DUF47 family protein [Methanomassiliicoccales archaeon]TFG55168.1 MAG: DUF47 family protein [Methanomassiliicoccus sp.]